MSKLKPNLLKYNYHRTLVINRVLKPNIDNNNHIIKYITTDNNNKLSNFYFKLLHIQKLSNRISNILCKHQNCFFELELSKFT